MHGAVRFPLVACLSCRLVHRRGAHRGETVGKDIGRRHRRSPLPVQGKIVGPVPGFAVFREKIKSLPRDFQPAFLAVGTHIKCREHVNDAPLHPHVFFRVVNRTVTVQRGKISAVFLIDTMRFPERNHIVNQFIFITLHIR